MAVNITHNKCLRKKLAYNWLGISLCSPLSMMTSYIKSWSRSACVLMTSNIHYAIIKGENFLESITKQDTI